jgi:hypothetical protein
LLATCHKWPSTLGFRLSIVEVKKATILYPSGRFGDRYYRPPQNIPPGGKGKRRRDAGNTAKSADQER